MTSAIPCCILLNGVPSRSLCLDGGYIRTAADVRRMLNAGADKVSFNTAAIHNPDPLDECSSSFGSQCTVLAIDARRKVDEGWQVFTHGGRNPTERMRCSGRSRDASWSR